MSERASEGCEARAAFEACKAREAREECARQSQRCCKAGEACFPRGLTKQHPLAAGGRRRRSTLGPSSIAPLLQPMVQFGSAGGSDMCNLCAGAG